MQDAATPKRIKAAQEPGVADLEAAAMAAHARTDYPAALELWAELRGQSPRAAIGYIGAIRTAKAAGREELVPPLVRDGKARIQRIAERLDREAGAASWEAEDTAWHKLMAEPRGNRDRELEAALGALERRHLGQRCYEVALARLDVVRTRHPNSARVCFEQLLIMRKLEQYERAIELSTAYVARFPTSAKLVLAHVSLLNAVKRFDEAFAAVVALRELNKRSSKIECAYVHALCQLGRLEEAEEAASRAAADFPDDEPLAREYASVASHNGDWPEAMKRLREAALKWPDSVKIQKRVAALRVQMPDEDAASQTQSADEVSAVFARFESLGGSKIGCEFGLVQRSFGSTTLGLLRWTTMDRVPVIQGVLNGFEGLTEPGNISLKTYRPHGNREEWVVTDQRYGFNSHTFIETKDAPEDKLLIQTSRRLSFLRGKLFEDLEIGSKILVYKSVEPTSDAQIMELFDAVRRRGPARLLCVIRADDAHPNGSFRVLGDGLFVGYIRYFKYEVVPEGFPSTDNWAWKEICTQVVAAIDAADSVTEVRKAS